MIRSLIRPVTNSSSSCRNPKSPVLRNGPSPVSFRQAWKVSWVASGFRQYPWATLGPRTQISPIWPSGQVVIVSGSAITIVWSTMVWPHPTSFRTPSASGLLSATRPSPMAAASKARIRGGSLGYPPETIRVASASPKQGKNASRRKPHGPKASTNRSIVSSRTGSAPLKASSQLLRSSLARCSAVIFRTHNS